MKIVFDHQMFSVQKYGGVTRYFIELEKGLDDSGCNATILPFVYQNKYLKDIGYRKGIYFKHIPNKFRLSVNNVLTDYWLARNQIDILHITNYTNHVYNKNVGKKIVTVYDMIHEIYWNKFSDKKKNTILSADHVICISESTRNDLLRLLPVEPEKVSVVYLAASIEKDIDRPRIIKDDYILYVGHRDAYKNFQMLLDVYESSELKNKLKIVAFGKPFKPRELQELRKKGITEQVINISGSDELLSNLYTYAEMLVYPSEYEGFGLPPLEAMAIGCPVICSNTSSLPEVVGDAAITIDPKDKQQLLNGIELILQNEELRNNLIRKGKVRAAQFSWKRCAEETLAVYKKVLGQ